MSEEIDHILESTPIEPPQVDAPPATFEEALQRATDKYMELVKNVQEKFKYHHDLSGAMEAGIRSFKERLTSNHDQLLYTLSDNFLYCLEAVKDMNTDYFLYQVEKIKKKSGKIEKMKVSRLIGKAQMKVLLKESDDKMRTYIFTHLTEIFQLLTTKNENDELVFYPQFVEFVKENLNDSKNYSKMLVSIDNVEAILDDTVQPISWDEANVVESSDSEDEKDKKKKKDKKKGSGKGMEEQFMKGLENTKIAQLAKNISEKINPEEFPIFNDPSKILSSLTNPGSGEGGLGNLLKFVVDEVHTALNQEGMDQNDLINEASGLMGNLQGMGGMGGFNPMDMLKSMTGGGDGDMPDMSQLAGIFEGLNKNLGEQMQNIVEEKEKQEGSTKAKKNQKKK